MTTFVGGCPDCGEQCYGRISFDDVHGREGCVFCSCKAMKEVSDFTKQLEGQRDLLMEEQPERFPERGGHFGHKQSLQNAYLQCPEKCGPELLKKMAATNSANHKRNAAARFLQRHPEITGYDGLLREYGYVRTS